MRRLTFASLAALALAVAAAAAPRLLAPPDLAEVEQRGVLRVLAVVVDDEPEFFSLKPAGPPGFDQEVLDGYARLRRLKLEVVRLASWDALVPALLDGKGDVIAGRFTATDSRRKRIDFTAETFPTRSVVISRKPHHPVETLEQLAQEKIGIVKGTSLAEAMGSLKIPKANVDDQVPSGGLPAALKSGRITCAIDELAGAIILKRRDPEIQIGLFVGSPGSYAFGVRKGEAQLLLSLNDYIENLRRTPTWSRLVVKYFGESAIEILNKARAQ
jgi:ABC-type amino acid transport substrate-binding protein